MFLVSLLAANTALMTLHSLLLPFVLRRTKTAVLTDLPPKTIQDVTCSLTPAQVRPCSLVPSVWCLIVLPFPHVVVPVLPGEALCCIH